MQVLDVSDPTNLRQVGYYEMPAEVRSVFVSGSHIYVADGEGGLFILRFTR